MWPFSSKKQDFYDENAPVFSSKSIENPINNPQAWSMVMGGFPKRWNNVDDLFLVENAQSCENAFQNAIVQACVTEIAYSMPEPRLELGHWKKGKSSETQEWVVIQKHPLLDLFDDPFEGFSMEELITRMSISWELTGAAYLWKVSRKQRGMVDGLLHLPTSWVNLKLGEGLTRYTGWQFGGERSSKWRDMDELVMWENLHPGSLTRRCSSLQAALPDVKLDNESQQFTGEMLANLDVPGIVMVAKSGFNTQKEKQEKRRDLEAQCGGRSGARGKTLLVGGDVEITQHTPWTDLDWGAFSETREARICMSFGVPPILVATKIGMLRATYANYPSARKSFYRETMRPRWNRMGVVLTRELIRKTGDEKLVLRFRYDELEEFQESRNEKANRILPLYNTGIISRETARKELGYPAEIDENEFFKSGNDAGSGFDTRYEAVPDGKPNSQFDIDESREPKPSDSTRPKNGDNKTDKD